MAVNVGEGTATLAKVVKVTGRACATDLATTFSYLIIVSGRPNVNFRTLIVSARTPGAVCPGFIYVSPNVRPVSVGTYPHG